MSQTYRNFLQLTYIYDDDQLKSTTITNEKKNVYLYILRFINADDIYGFSIIRLAKELIQVNIEDVIYYWE